MKRRIRIHGFLIFLGILAVIIFPLFFLRASTNIFDEIIELWGMVMILGGLLLRISSRGYKSEHSQDGHTLVKDGPYALVRNPMYLGTFIIGSGIVLMLFHWWVFFIFVFFMVAQYVRLILKEEKLLIKNFAQEYSDYQKRVPRLFPKISLLLNSNIKEYLPLKLKWIKSEASSVLLLPLLSLAFECWEDYKLEHHWNFFSQICGFLVVMGLFVIFTLFLARPDENISREGRDNK